jgi:NAD(P)-dependent dehydrogenase (short-subunit alcohol dehydrogenase family)
MRVWLVTGSNRGLGLGIARAALAKGDAVVAAARDVNTLGHLAQAGDRLFPVLMDVRDDVAVRAAVEQALERFGRIDVLVNNAGYGRLGWFETLSESEIRDQFEVNLFGAMRVTRAVLPTMRAQRSGHVFTISSVAGISVSQGGSIYGASKHAVEGWMEGMGDELRPFGIHCTIVQPGYFRTDFLDHSSVSYGSLEIDDYSASLAAFRARLERTNHKQHGDPDKIGILLCELASMQSPPLRVAAGSDAVQVVLNKSRTMAEEAERLRSMSESTDRHGTSR